MKPFLLSLVLALAACANATSNPDMAMPVREICPSNPQFCETGSICCGDACTDTRVNPFHCGGCNQQCAAGTVCSNGRCGCLPLGTACGQGQSCCGNSGCKSLDSDIKNCGGCGKVCGEGATCEGGVCKCGGVACAAGEVCCNGACAASCATIPDMATAACVCPSGCPLSKTCVGPNCCLEQVFLGGSCQPDPNCLQSTP